MIRGLLLVLLILSGSALLPARSALAERTFHDHVVVNALFVSVPLLHVMTSAANHPGFADGREERFNVVSPGIAVHYGHRLTEWFEIGLGIDYLATVHDDDFGLEVKPLHQVRFPIRIRLVKVLSPTWEISTAVDFGMSLFVLAGEVTSGWTARGHLGVRMAVDGPWSLYVDTGAGYGEAPANRNFGYSQQAFTLLRLDAGVAWNF